MRALWPGLAVLALAHPPLLAQEASWEIGSRLGVTRLWARGDGDTDLRLPGAGVLGQPTLYATYLFGSGEAGAGPSYGVEAEVGLVKSLSDGGGTILLLALQPTYFLSGVAANSPYFGLGLALLSVEGSDEVSLGGSVGYRLLVHTHVAVRLQVNYRRWIDDEINELSGAVLIGLLVP